MLEGSIAFTLSGVTNSKFKALFSVWLPDYKGYDMNHMFYEILTIKMHCFLTFNKNTKEMVIKI